MGHNILKPPEYKWTIKSKGNDQTIKKLAHELQIDEVLANLLVQRGITNFDEAKIFFRPQLSHLHDPFEMDNMDKAIERLNAAINNNERILIYGDYDVDGTTSVAMLFMFLRQQYINLVYYIPDRYTEGYGISYTGIDYAYENNCSLIIALDCGIKAVEKINYAKSHGIDFIICDHHTPGEELPNAEAVLDPKKEECLYPYKELSGCGVTFKLMQGFAQNNNISSEVLFNYLDLVAVSIASDIVSITGENRVLTYYGLKKLNNDPSTGLNAIINEAGIKNQEITVNDIVFKIGPRINAAGRIESGNTAVALLMSDNEKYVNKLSKEIDSYNKFRKNVDQKITKEALELINNDPELQEKKSTVLYNPEWHEGVIGIVSSRVKEYYYRPTIMLTDSKEYVTGSARSVEGFDIYNALAACSDLLKHFGGHKYAAGLTIRKEYVEAFKKKFEEIVQERITKEQLIPTMEADDVIEFAHITPKFFRILKQFRPFGPGNLEPVFLTKNLSDKGYSKLVGNDQNHLKLYIYQNHNTNKCLPGIAFQQGALYDLIKKGKKFDICFSLFENKHNGKHSLEIYVKDIKIK